MSQSVNEEMRKNKWISKPFSKPSNHSHGPVCMHESIATCQGMVGAGVAGARVRCHVWEELGSQTC